METWWRYVVFLGTSFFFFFFKIRLRLLARPLVALIMTKFAQNLILWERFRNILKESFKGQKNT